MFATLRNKLKDVGTLSVLCKEAERIARSDGKEAPGSEHFFLASLCLEDGTARRAFASLGGTAQTFDGAVRTQLVEALRHVGLDTPETDVESPSHHRVPGPSKLYRAAPSGQSFVQRLASSAEARKARSLLSADTLLTVAEEEFSIAARALTALGITSQQLVDAAGREIALYEQR